MVWKEDLQKLSRKKSNTGQSSTLHTFFKSVDSLLEILLSVGQRQIFAGCYFSSCGQKSEIIKKQKLEESSVTELTPLDKF